LAFSSKKSKRFYQESLYLTLTSTPAFAKERSVPGIFSNPLGSFSNPADRWWIVGILTLTLAGALYGFFFLPNALFGLGGMRIGILVFFVLGALLKAVVREVYTARYSRRSLFWWSMAFLTATIAGAVLGCFFLPDMVLFASRILLGACVGCIGLLLPIVLAQVFIVDPIESFSEVIAGIIEAFLRRFIASGCCFAVAILFFAIVGAISGLIIR
jgi:hypothetical protein